MSIVIRRAIQADWAKIIALHRRASVHERRLTGISTDADIADAQHHFRGELCVAMSGRRLLGFVSWMENELAWLYVEPASFRRGIGTMLVQHALDHCGFVAHIRVLAGNAPMLALCAAQGFVPAEEQAEGGEGPPSIRMRRLSGIIAEPIGVRERPPMPRLRPVQE
jgi:[ribosomal protein S18]-alanine N-acetyltransferase